jgi:hypothetical protein
LSHKGYEKINKSTNINTTKTYTSPLTQTIQHNAICVGHNYAQTNTNNVNKTTGGKDDLNIAFMRKSLRISQHETQYVLILVLNTITLS